MLALQLGSGTKEHQDALVKQVSAAGFQLKGCGWYATDFKGGSKPAAKPDAKPEAKADGAAGKAEGGKSDAPAASSAPASGCGSGCSCH